MYKRILVPIDGSVTAQCGLREAISLAKDLGATLRVVNVISEFPVMMEMAAVANFENVRRQLVQRSEELLQGAAAQADRHGVRAETGLHELDGGRVADAILDEARQCDCDLIVIGTHGRRGVSRALLGSDAERVARQAEVPVLLVRSRPSDA